MRPEVHPQSAGAVAALTAPGAPFEIVEASVRGLAMPVFARVDGTLARFLQVMRAHGDADFIVEGDRRIGYAEAHARAMALAARLQAAHGVRPGDRVAIAMRNSADWMIAFIAAATVGAIPALINSRGTGPEMRYCIEDVGAALSIVDAARARALREAGHAGALLEARGDAFDHLPAGSPEPSAGHVDDPACILFTSGTTGRPKGAVLSHRAILSGLMVAQHAGAEMLAGMAAALGLDMATLAAHQPPPAALLVFPLFHISGAQAIFLSTLARGGKIVLMPRWDAAEALRLIEAERITAFSGPPTVIWDMLRVPERATRDLSSLKSLGTGGQALPINLLQAMREAFPATLIGGGYGMTETAGAVSIAMGDAYTARPESSGRTHRLAQLRVVDEAGRDLPPGEVGELLVRGPMVMSGYWGRDAETARALDADGWLSTGDVGHVDEVGYVTIVDRKTDMVISGGENIYCAEVERVLTEHPDIVEAAAFGLHDERLGERLVAAVVARPGAVLAEDAVRAHVGRHLAAYKVPREVMIEPTALPRSATGKIDKRLLRTRALARHGEAARAEPVAAA